MPINPEKLIVALDLPSFEEAKKWVEKLSPTVSFFKVGLRLFTQEGPKVVEWLKKNGMKVFLDLKFHDIPNTVFQAVQSAVEWNVDLLTVHASGGAEMLSAAVDGAKESSTKVFAVTVLTSMTDLKFLGTERSLSEQVLSLAQLACKSGLNGIIASPHELVLLRQSLPPLFQIITPGIRLSAALNDDQKRTATPQEAIQRGADYIVVGRPLLQSESPLKVVQEILS